MTERERIEKRERIKQLESKRRNLYALLRDIPQIVPLSDLDGVRFQKQSIRSRIADIDNELASLRSQLQELEEKK